MMSPSEIAAVQADAVLERRNIPWRQVADETVLLDQQGHVILGLNSTGGRVWALLDGQRTLAEIANVLSDEYQRDESKLGEHVLAFGRLLLSRELAAIRPK